MKRVVVPFLLLFLGFALPVAASDLDTLRTSLDKQSVDAGPFCGYLPMEAGPIIREISTGSQTGEASFPSIAAFVEGLPRIEDSTSGGQSTNIDIGVYLKIGCSVCFLEEAWNGKLERAAVDPLFERLLYYLLVWRIALPEHMVVNYVLQTYRPELLADPKVVEDGISRAAAFNEKAARTYAAAALRLLDSHKDDHLYLRRVRHFLDMRRDYMGASVAGEMVAEKTKVGADCLLAARLSYRGLAIKKGDTIAKRCKTRVEKKYRKTTLESLRKIKKAAQTAQKLEKKTDKKSRQKYVNALLDMGRSDEGFELLVKMWDEGMRDAAVAIPLSLQLVAKAAYVQAVDVVAAVPDDQWDVNAAHALGGAAGMLMMHEILQSAGAGADGVRKVLEQRKPWFSAVVNKVSKDDKPCANYMSMVFDAALRSVKAEESRWKVIGDYFREELGKHEEQFKVDAIWGRLTVLGTLFSNKDSEAKMRLEKARKALGEDEELYPVSLSLSIVVDLLNDKVVSEASAKAASRFKNSFGPLSALGAALFLSGNKANDAALTGKGVKLLKTAVEKLPPGKHRIAALNNLAVAMAYLGEAQPALDLIGVAHAQALSQDDKTLLQLNGLSIVVAGSGLNEENSAFLMSVTSAEGPSALAKLIAARLLLRNKKAISGLKTAALEQVQKESLEELEGRGLYDLDMRAAVQGGLNFSIAPVANLGGAVDVDFKVSADVTMYLWYEPSDG